MKSFILLYFMLSFSAISAQNLKTFHQFSVKTIDGDSISLSVFKGKKVLVVNTASRCGFTPQYKELEELYAQYGGDKFVIVGFPSNNFLSQEPGSNSEIKEFCKKNYGVSFPMMEKISVKGKNIHPLYQWLTQKEENGVSDAKVQWNFQKFLIDEDGKWIGVVAPSESPKCDKIIQWLNNK